MPRFRLRTVLELALGVALAGSAGILVHQYRQSAGLRRELGKERESIRQLGDLLRQQEHQVPPPVEPPPPVNPDAGALNQRNATIHQLNRELSEAHIATRQLQVQLANLHDEHDKALQAADEQLRKIQADWQAQLELLQQKLDAAEAEAQAARQRNLALDADNARLRSEADGSSVRTAELVRLTASLEDVNRRRDTYLTSLLRRYRDVTSQLRGMSGMLDASHEQTAGACSSEALARIQNVVSQAEDDLRQLNDLNARARQIEKKLTTK